jgi:hypothetical protein
MTQVEKASGDFAVTSSFVGWLGADAHPASRVIVKEAAARGRKRIRQFQA